MVYPERFADLPVATWPRLRGLLDNVRPGATPVNMTIGEPQHAFPPFVAEVLMQHIAEFSKYPSNDGTPELLEAIAGWIERRFGARLTTDCIMALNGSREGLYNAAMALCPERKNGQTPAVLIPNPFYPVYGMATLSVGAEPVYVPATQETGFLPDFGAVDPAILSRTALVYLCSPSNPQGAVADADYWARLLTLAEQHDFIILSDECYSEVYRETAPVGGLEMVARLGADPERVVVFHSLSKRSNLAGLRSGFCAGGTSAIARIRQIRASAGAPLPGPVQAVSAKVWQDEAHVTASRDLYRAKFDVADEIFGNLPGYHSPPAGFFLWLPVPDGEEAARQLWAEHGVRVLPGSYLGRAVNGVNPGQGYIRVALVAPQEEVRRGLELIRDGIYGEGNR